jgi:hypothetical protein
VCVSVGIIDAKCAQVERKMCGVTCACVCVSLCYVPISARCIRVYDCV